MYCIVTYSRPSLAPAPKTRTTLGWRIETSASYSRWKRIRNSRSSLSSGAITFSATSRSW